MKKALALVLALVLALSMAVSAFAVQLVELTKDPVTVDGPKPVVLSSATEEGHVYYTTESGVYYIALEDKDWKDVKVSANGNVSAELVEYNPDTMYLVEVVDGKYVEVPVYFAVTCKGEKVVEGLSYTAALAEAAAKNEAEKVTYYGITMTSHVNVIKVTVADNYSVSYQSGNLTIKATLDKVAYSTTLTFINDVSIFEYELVKWTAANTAANAVLELEATNGYSDYETAAYGYGHDYNPADLRKIPDAAVISTTAFRAIAGKDIVLTCKDGIAVAISDIAAGQKGVNFKHRAYVTYANGATLDLDEAVNGIVSVNLDFYGNQTIASEYTVTLGTNYTWYTLREAFGVKVEEDDIVTYYLLKDGKVVKEYVVDYMTADYDEKVALSYTGSNSALGSYELVLEVPAVEGGESNPNTGAESVVGVVAALAVVSLATAAAVSLKK